MTHVPLWIVPAVNGLADTIVSEDVPNAADGEEERHDPRHPGKCHDRCQESTRAEHVTPAKVPPLLSGDSSTNDPHGEEDYQSNQFATEG